MRLEGMRRRRRAQRRWDPVLGPVGRGRFGGKHAEGEKGCEHEPEHSKLLPLIGIRRTGRVLSVYIQTTTARKEHKPHQRTYTEGCSLYDQAIKQVQLARH